MATHTNLSLQEQEEQEHYNQVQNAISFSFTSPFSANVTNFIIFLLICLAIYLAYEHLYKGSESAVPSIPVVPGRLNTFYF